MKNLIFYLVALTVVLAACQPKEGQQDTDKKTTLQERLATTELETRVRDIYAAVFKVYNEEDSLRNLDEPVVNGVLDNRDEFAAKYCSHEWNDLLRAIENNDLARHQGELGFWEADYWIMGQDWHELSVNDVKVTSLNGDSATVEFNLHNLGNVTPVCLDMVREDGVWKIDNFINATHEFDLKASMKEYLAHEKDI
ncbi:MAG: DUF3828 domain-containing protein [Muribaculaceae bacterium]|nr:DUF3828 domain-containing protein [Muribaculaceae bacterium]